MSNSRAKGLNSIHDARTHLYKKSVRFLSSSVAPVLPVRGKFTILLVNFKI